jgi:hypothetical protein
LASKEGANTRERPLASGALLRKFARKSGELERGIVHQTRLERRAMR